MARVRDTVRERLSQLFEQGRTGTVMELMAQMRLGESSIRLTLQKMEADGSARRVGKRNVLVRNSRNDTGRIVEADLWGEGNGRPPAELRHKLAEAEVRSALRAAAVWPQFMVGRCGASQCTQHAST